MTHRTAKQYALIDDGSASHAFVSGDRAPFSASGSSVKIMLGSGFRSSSLDYAHPISAALQLNGDLTDLDNEQLKRFADAELEKHNKISFRSYDVDADFSVCVLADDPKRLDQFFDTYGGILEIEPLLVDFYHPDYTTIEEIDISEAAKGYAINYTVKSPVNRSRCNYCGICGAICPEQCILENLCFDFSRCTHCTECINACPVDAIDLYSIERISMDIPALIILGEPPITEPDNTQFIYRETQIADFLATIYSCRVDEVITCNHDICHFNGIGKAGCTVCLSACKFGAVKVINKEIQIDAFACTECGVCTACCPTGALQNNKLTDQTFIEFFRTFEMVSGSRIIIGSDQNLHRFWWRNNQKHFKHTLFLEIPREDSLASLHVLFLVSHGARQVIVLGNDDGGGSELHRTIHDANLFCKKMLGVDQIVSLISNDDDVPENVSESEAEAPDKAYQDLSFVNRRRKLSSVVQHLADAAPAPILFSESEIRHWAAIVCEEEKCTQCLACLNVCKIESLSADQENLALCWNGGLCIGCSGCVATCPEQALTLKSEVELTVDFFTDQEISRAEPMRCISCGKVFGTKKSFDRVIAILTEKQGAPPDHLQYCEDCRVIKLMESK